MAKHISIIVLGIFGIAYGTLWLTSASVASQATMMIVYAPIAIVGIAGIAGVVYGAVALYIKVDTHKHKQAFVLPDVNGLIPVDSSFAKDGRLATLALQEFHNTQRLKAIHQPGQTPHHISIRNDNTSSGMLPVADEMTRAALNVPSFASLLDSGKIGKGNPITLGFDEDGKPYETHWNGLYSSGIGGRQGSGKSWTAASIIAQSVLHGAKLVVCDIHAGDDESISNRIAPLSSTYLFDTADTPKKVITAIKNVDSILVARSDGRDKSRNVILLVFDEYTSTMRRLGKDEEEVSNMLANIASEGRKFGVFALLIGHNWQSEATGGSAVRDNLTSTMVHNLRVSEARMLTGLTAASLPKDTHALRPGEYYLLPKSGDMVKIQTPRMTDSDIARVGQLLLTDGKENLYDLRSASTGETVDLRYDDAVEYIPQMNHKSTVSEAVYTAPQTVKHLSPEAVEVQRLFFTEKLSITEIVFKVKGVKGNQGAKYQIALNEVQDLLRESV